jgi:hypothetical protein
VPGGESDQQTAARFTEPETILQVIEWGERYGVPVFVKQLGAPLACALGLRRREGRRLDGMARRIQGAKNARDRAADAFLICSQGSPHKAGKPGKDFQF